MLRLILPASATDSVTAFSTAAVTRSEPAKASAARSLAVLAVFLTNSRAASGTSRFWMFLKASLKPSKAVFVSVVMGLSILNDLSYGLTPSVLARGMLTVAYMMPHRNNYVALQYHETVIILRMWQNTASLTVRFRPGTD